jgi:hypothetical protein
MEISRFRDPTLVAIARAANDASSEEGSRFSSGEVQRAINAATADGDLSHAEKVALTWMVEGGAPITAEGLMLFNRFDPGRGIRDSVPYPRHSVYVEEAMLAATSTAGDSGTTITKAELEVALGEALLSSFIDSREQDAIVDTVQSTTLTADAKTLFDQVAYDHYFFRPRPPDTSCPLPCEP